MKKGSRSTKSKKTSSSKGSASSGSKKSEESSVSLNNETSSTNSVLKTLVSQSKKRTLELFLENHGTKPTEDEPSLKVKLTIKINDEYERVKDLPAPSRTVEPPVKAKPPQVKPTPQQTVVINTVPDRPGVVNQSQEVTEEVLEATEEGYFRLIDSLPSTKKPEQETSLVQYKEATSGQLTVIGENATSRSHVLAIRNPYSQLRPSWNPPWKLMRVISGHLGWVRAVAMDVSNEWFVTGAADRCIKIWDLASGTLKLTLTGHINCVRGLAVSKNHPYFFSCAEDKTVRCWDLEYNKVIRQYHGHLSGVYCLALHPTLDVFVTGGRDSTARVWDIRTKANVHVLGGHQQTVFSVACQSTDPQVISGSADSTIRLWDLAKGSCMSTLTHHKKSIRALQLHPTEYTMASGGADNIKKWKFPEGKFLQNFSGHYAPIETLALNGTVMMSGASNGTMYFWDWKTGYNFQKLETTAQSGSLASEAGVFASTFDHTGSRLITCEADKTIKVWKEDENATEETHPVEWKPTYQK